MTAPLTDEELKAARALCDAATPGEWRHEPHVFSPNRGNIVAGAAGSGAVALDCYLADGAFVAASRSLVPRLLDEIDRLRFELADCEASIASQVTPLINELNETRAIIASQLPHGRHSGDVDAWAVALEQIARLRAALEVDEPAEEPCAKITVGTDFRCHICNGVIAAGSEAAVFEADGPRPIMHWGPCPFSERRVGLANSKGGGLISIRAQVYGLWALHKTIGLGMTTGDSWSVTHIPSGMAVPRGFLTRREAWRIVEALGRECSGDEFASIHEQALTSEPIGTVQRVVDRVLAEVTP